MEANLFEAIRLRCAEVSRRARYVRVDREALRALAARFARTLIPLPNYDEKYHYRSAPEETAAYVITLDAINFGSGYFPHLAKRPGLSGYLTVASALKAAFETRGPLAAGELSEIRAEGCAALLGQALAGPEVHELMELYASALRDLGRFVEENFSGCFSELIRAADTSAEALVRLLSQLRDFRDVARYEGLEVPFYKRAQITASDLAQAFDGRGLGTFRDLESLTLMADNLVPHVLRVEGVLIAAPELAARIEREEGIPWGCAEEVELRAAAVHAVEGLVADLRQRGIETSARRLDHYLWWSGQRPEVKAHPRHRTRCTYY